MLMSSYPKKAAHASVSATPISITAGGQTR